MASASTTRVDRTASLSSSPWRGITAGGSGRDNGGEYSNANNENKGFSSLPAGLISEIISHLPTFSVPTHETNDNPKAHHDAIAVRRYTLHFLSQSCRSLRGVLRRYVWERVEVFDGMKTLGGGYLPAKWEGDFEGQGTPRSKHFAEEVMRQLEYVTVQDPSLAKYVKVANIIITDYSPGRVLRMVAESFSLFPNLHTVQLILEVAPKNAQLPKAIFTNYQYPQIRRLSLTSNALFLINCCPQLHGVVPYLGVPFSGVPGDQDMCCPTVEVLGITTLSRLMEISILNNMKNLRDISLHVPSIFILTNSLRKFLLLPHLHTIRLRMDKRDTSITGRRYPQTPSAAEAAEAEKEEVGEQQKIESYIHSARDDVRSMQRTSDSTNDSGIRVEKKIIVTYRGGRNQTFVV